MNYTPFPVDLLPRPVSDFITEAAAAIGCDESYVAVPLLVSLASAIGNSRRILLKKGWREPPVLWAGVVAESGTSKTPTADEATKYVRRRQQHVFNEDRIARSKHESAVKEWKQLPKGDRGDEPVPPNAMQHIYCADVTVEALADRLEKSPRGVFVNVDELAGWFASFNQYKAGAGGDVTAYLSMYGAKELKVDRKTGDRPTMIIPRAAVCIFGGIQPGILQRACTREFFDNGLVARFLLARPPRRPKQWSEREVSDKTDDAMRLLFDALYDFKPVVGMSGEAIPADVALDSGAKLEWVEFVNAHSQEQAGLGDSELLSAWSKLEGYAARLALVVHCCRHAAGERMDAWNADADSLRAGVALARWFGGETRRLYEELAGGEDQRNDSELRDWILRKGGTVSEREIQNGGPRRYRPKDTATMALEKLVEAGCGEWVHSRPTSAGGKPHRTFRLFPSDPGDGGDGDNTGGPNSAGGGIVAVASDGGRKKGGDR